MHVARTNADIIRYALRGEDARTGNGNMSTDHYREGFSRYAPYTGHLSRGWARVLDNAFRAGRITQVIYSYSTPIAWRDTRYGWIIPVASYSITTSSKHQTHLYRLIGSRRIGAPWDAPAEEIQRVIDGHMVFTTNSRGEYVSIKAA